MKIASVYKTRDNKVFNSKQSAVSHCLTEAHLKLTELLKSVDCEAAYITAQKIVFKAVDGKNNDLNEAYYQLFETVYFIKDSHITEKE